MTNRKRNVAILLVLAVLGASIFVSTGGAHEASVPRCAAIQHEVQVECGQMQENQWYNGGSVDYLRQDHLKDITRCDNLATNIFHFCSNPQ